MLKNGKEKKKNQMERVDSIYKQEISANTHTHENVCIYGSARIFFNVVLEIKKSFSELINRLA